MRQDAITTPHRAGVIDYWRLFSSLFWGGAFFPVHFDPFCSCFMGGHMVSCVCEYILVVFVEMVGDFGVCLG